MEKALLCVKGWNSNILEESSGFFFDFLINELIMLLSYIILQLVYKGVR